MKLILSAMLSFLLLNCATIVKLKDAHKTNDLATVKIRQLSRDTSYNEERRVYRPTNSDNDFVMLDVEITNESDQPLNFATAAAGILNKEDNGRLPSTVQYVGTLRKMAGSWKALFGGGTAAKSVVLEPKDSIFRRYIYVWPKNSLPAKFQTYYLPKDGETLKTLEKIDIIPDSK